MENLLEAVLPTRIIAPADDRPRVHSWLLLAFCPIQKEPMKFLLSLFVATIIASGSFAQDATSSPSPSPSASPKKTHRHWGRCSSLADSGYSICNGFPRAGHSCDSGNRRRQMVKS